MDLVSRLNVLSRVAANEDREVIAAQAGLTQKQLASVIKWGQRNQVFATDNAKKLERAIYETRKTIERLEKIVNGRLKRISLYMTNGVLGQGRREDEDTRMWIPIVKELREQRMYLSQLEGLLARTGEPLTQNITNTLIYIEARSKTKEEFEERVTALSEKTRLLRAIGEVNDMDAVSDAENSVVVSSD